MKISSKALTGLGVLLTFLALTKFFAFDALIRALIRNQVTLNKKSEVRGIYLKIPFPINFKAYFFNVTNPMDVQNGSTPILKEIGPYWYEKIASKGSTVGHIIQIMQKFEWPEYIEKVDVVDNDTEDSLIYSPRFQYHFNKSKSGKLSDEDYVTIIHPVIVAMVNKVAAEMPSFLSIVNKALVEIFKEPDSIFLTAKVKEILFEGFQVNCDVKAFGATAICQQLKSNVPGLKTLPENEKIYLFSLFGMQNGTSTKRFKVLRGVRKSKDLGRLIMVDGKSKTDVWATDKCNRFEGTDGWIFPPMMEAHVSLKTYSPDLCRNVEAKHVNDTILKGIHVRIYEADLGDQSGNPEDKCYCETPTTCLKKGVFSLNKCLQVPILATLPHFLNADRSYLEQVEGLNPDPEKHKLIIHFESMTGTPLFAAKRMQLNLDLKPIPQIDLMKNVPVALHPILWIEETVDLDGEYLDRVKGIFKMINMTHISLWIGLVLSLVGLGIAVFYYKKTQRKFNLNQVHEINPPPLYNVGQKNTGSLEERAAYDNHALSGHEFEKY